MLETYLGLLQAHEECEGENREQAFYKTYSFPVGDEEKTITVRIAQAFHVVGLVEWEAGLYLAEFIIAHPGLFRGQVCLELGSGIGLTGMVLGMVGGPKQVVFTDYLEDPVIVNLRANIENSGFLITPLNREDTPEPQRENGQPKMSVAQLDWLDFREEELLCYRPDAIIAADVLYDPSLVDGCIKVISVLLKHNPACQVYIASTIRNEKTFGHFLSRAHEMGLEVGTASLSANPPSLATALPFDLPAATPYSQGTLAPPPLVFPYVRENKIFIITTVGLASTKF
jgi:predicted nicotinamide N-methyase